MQQTAMRENDFTTNDDNNGTKTSIEGNIVRDGLLFSRVNNVTAPQASTQGVVQMGQRANKNVLLSDFDCVAHDLAQSRNKLILVRRSKGQSSKCATRYGHSAMDTTDSDGLATYILSKHQRFLMISHDLAYVYYYRNIIHIFARWFGRCALYIILYYGHSLPRTIYEIYTVTTGASDSGKNEFVSDVLRQIYSCGLTGSLNNATLREDQSDEINTDLMNMMRSHLC